jgi:hypothetical protein
MVDDPANDPVRFHLAKLLDQHLLRNCRDRTFQVREAQQRSSEQVEQDDQFPPTFKEPERLLDATRGRDRRMIDNLTVG